VDPKLKQAIDDKHNHIRPVEQKKGKKKSLKRHHPGVLQTVVIYSHAVVYELQTSFSPNFETISKLQKYWLVFNLIFTYFSCRNQKIFRCSRIHFYRLRC